MKNKTVKDKLVSQRAMQAAWIPNTWDLQMISVQNRLMEAKNKIAPRVRARLQDLDRLTKKITQVRVGKGKIEEYITTLLFLGIWKNHDTWYYFEHEAQDSYLPAPVNELIAKIIG